MRGRAIAALAIATIAASPACRSGEPPSLIDRIPDALLAASETRCGEQRLLRPGPGGRLRLTQALDAALLKVRPVRLTPAEAKWMLEEGWESASVEARATIRLPGFACAGLDTSKARLLLALDRSPESGGESSAAVRVVAAGRTLAEGSVGGASSSALLDAGGEILQTERVVEIVPDSAGAIALRGVALPLARAPIEIDHEYRDAFVASSVREAAFRIVPPPQAQIRFGMAIAGAPAVPSARGAAGWTFSIRVSDGSGETEVFNESLSGGGAWIDRRVDLSHWSGGEITLTLVARPSGGSGTAPPLALWGSPIVEPAGTTTAATAASSGASRPDVLLISVDTLRGDRIGRMNGGREVTPVLNALARAGVIFTQCRTQAPSTLYSHAAILTGLPPAAHGATTTSALPGEIPSLPDLLGREGYATAALTDDGLLDGRFGLSRGFDSFRNRYETVEEKVRAAIEKMKDLPHPWFLFLHTYQIHVPYEPPADVARAFTSGDGSSFGLSLDARTMIRINNGVVPVTAADVRHIESLYDAQVNRTDAALGRLFEEMKSRGGWDGTVVAVTGDHGEEFDEHGVVGWHSLHCYEEVERVPLIVKPSGSSVSSGRRVSTAVRLIDVAPTLLDLAGISPPATMWGSSLTALLRGGSERDRETTCEIEDGRGAVLFMQGWKYHMRTAESAADPRAFRRRVSLRGRYPIEELFDLRRDPGEQHDLAGKNPDRARAMREFLNARLAAGRASLAALTHGHTPPPRPKEDDEHVRQLKALGYVN